MATNRGAAALLLALLAAGADGSLRAAGPIAGPGELRDVIGKAGKLLRQAEGALRGKDPGRVSMLLKAADEQLALFQEKSQVADLSAALKRARDTATAGDLTAARAAVGRAREILPGWSDYVIPRQAEVAGRQALSAAEAGNGPACLEAIAELESAVLAPVLEARLRGARDAVALGRKAMVRRDMAGGKEAAAAAREAVDGLRYAGALSRALYSLRISTELMEQGALMAAREQVREGVKQIQIATDLAPAAQRDSLAQAHADGFAVWRRMSRARAEDPAKVLEIARRIEEVRSRQR